MELLSNLGIDWRLFIAQAINFVVLLVILQRFLYKPLIGMLDKREARLKKGLELTASMEAKARHMEEERAQIVRTARGEAERIITAAVAQAEVSRVELLESARSDAMRILEEGKLVLKEEQKILIFEARKEVATLIVEGARKIMEELNSAAPNTEAITKAVSRLGKS